MHESTDQPNRECGQRSYEGVENHCFRPREFARRYFFHESSIYFTEFLVLRWDDVRRFRVIHFGAPLPMPEGMLESYSRLTQVCQCLVNAETFHVEISS
jgi:hypothetical protein